MSLLSRATGVDINLNKRKGPAITVDKGSVVNAVTNPIGMLENVTGQVVSPTGYLAKGPTGGIKNQSGVIDQSSTQRMSPEQMRAVREADIVAGKEMGTRLLPSGSLGRFTQTSTPETMAAMAAQKSLFTQGFNAPEFQAIRESRLRGLNRQGQAQSQQMQQAQARGGIGGALGASQLANLQRQQQIERQGAEQDLLAKNAEFRTGQLQNYANMAKGLEGYNLGQGDKEALAQLGTGLASAQMGLAERTGLQQTDIGRAMASAMAQQSNAGKK